VLAPISCSSACETPGFRCGQSRNQTYHAAAHATPARPKTKKAARQPYRAWIGTTSSGEMAAPIWLVIHTTPHARARWGTGIQRPMTTPAFGQAPASPMPKQKRTNMSHP